MNRGSLCRPPSLSKPVLSENGIVAQVVRRDELTRWQDAPMRADWYPFQVLIFTDSGWVNRHQQDMIACLLSRIAWHLFPLFREQQIVIHFVSRSVQTLKAQGGRHWRDRERL